MNSRLLKDYAKTRLSVAGYCVNSNLPTSLCGSSLSTRSRLAIMPSKLSKPLSLLALLTLIPIGLTSCATEAEPETPDTTDTGASEQQPEPEPEPEPVYVQAPLSGISYLEDSNPFLEGPALTAKIDNYPPARPQTGIGSADIVYVQRVEGGITRFVSIWHSSIPDTFGPLRSIRPMDPNIVSPYDGVFAYSGGQDPFVFASLETDLYNAYEDSEVGAETLFRNEGIGKPYEHTLYGRGTLLIETHSELPTPTPHLNYIDLENRSELSTANGTEFDYFEITYEEATSRWDVGSGEFSFDTQGMALPTGEMSVQTGLLRTQDEEIMVDERTGVQIAAKNLIVMNTTLDFSFKDPKYGSVPETVLLTQGDGWAFSDGKYIEILWSKESRTDHIQFTTLDGDPLKLLPGPTWIEFRDIGNSNEAGMDIYPKPEPVEPTE